MAGSCFTSRRRFLIAAAAVAGSTLIHGDVCAQEPTYGSTLMTREEQQAYRDRLRRASSEEERARIRAEHHAQMQERARLQGKTLPDQPPATGRRSGGGPGGGGMATQPGPGGGRGGGGRGR